VSQTLPATSPIPEDPLSDPSPLDERYGRRPPASQRRRLVLAMVGVGLLVAATAALFVWIRVAGSGVSFTVGGYDVRSDSQVTVTFTVAKPDGTAVSCRVTAQDRVRDVVGSQDVTLPAAGSELTRTTTLRTRGRAVVATVDSCVVVGGGGPG
jgi:Domain of unknown function (DUF4307)